jgi:hypothetical protein
VEIYTQTLRTYVAGGPTQSNFAQGVGLLQKVIKSKTGKFEII